MNQRRLVVRLTLTLLFGTAVLPLAATAPAQAAKTYTITEEYFATHTKEDLDRVTKYSNRQDKGAIMEMAAQGRVFATVPGMRVHLVKSAGVLGSMVKLRQVGKTREFWTVREAIQ